MIEIESEIKRSLILGAHGSRAADDSNQPVLELVNRVAELIRASDKPAFSNVTAAFLMSDPLMENVLDMLPPGDVVVVPVMTSDGYYLKKIPGILSQNQNADFCPCVFTEVVGKHSAIPKLMQNRVSSLLDQHKLPPAETTVVVVGHGTRRNPTSGDSTYALTMELKSSFQQRAPELSFTTGFLDQDPELSLVASEIKTPNVIVMPFLMSRGPHATDDVPEAFGLETGPQVQFPLVGSWSFAKQTGACVCDSPIGMAPGIEDLVMELANQAIDSICTQGLTL